jgi:hypothetical protein
VQLAQVRAAKGGPQARVGQELVLCPVEWNVRHELQGCDFCIPLGVGTDQVAESQLSDSDRGEGGMTMENAASHMCHTQRSLTSGHLAITHVRNTHGHSTCGVPWAHILQGETPLIQPQNTQYTHYTHTSHTHNTSPTSTPKTHNTCSTHPTYPIICSPPPTHRTYKTHNTETTQHTIFSLAHTHTTLPQPTPISQGLSAVVPLTVTKTLSVPWAQPHPAGNSRTRTSTHQGTKSESAWLHLQSHPGS